MRFSEVLQSGCLGLPQGHSGRYEAPYSSARVLSAVHGQKRNHEQALRRGERWSACSLHKSYDHQMRCRYVPLND